jgi:glycine dehydrogenase subunit 1
MDLDVEELPLAADGTTDLSSLDVRLADKRYAAVVLQSPNFFGAIDVPNEAARSAVKATGTVLIGVVAEALSLAVLTPPGAWGADIAVGEAQSFGNAQAYGGPYVGFIASTTEHLRRIPGRLVGRSLDNRGNNAYVLTLQAREQHIRREKATSNICTNQAHCALVATIYLAALGASGLERAAVLNLERTATLAERVCAIPGYTRAFSASVFNEVAIRVPAGLTAKDVLAALERDARVLGGVDLGRWYPHLADCILMNATEMTSDADIDALCAALAKVKAVRSGASEAVHV